MEDFYNPHERRKAVKQHRCTYCGETIEVGDAYTHQTGVHDGHWFTSKLHDECFDDLCENGDGEYAPYSNDRPTLHKATEHKEGL